jgi:hypothetical protein
MAPAISPDCLVGLGYIKVHPDMERIIPVINPILVHLVIPFMPP